MNSKDLKNGGRPGGVPAKKNTSPKSGSAFPRETSGTFAGRYEIVDKIGIGGMAAIYKVRDLVVGEELAIKIIRPEVATNDISHKRFRQEARAARDLNHPHIVSVHTYDISPEGVPFIIMEYVDGIDLGKVLRKNGPLPFNLFFTTFIQVAGALVHAHSRGVVHRDVKPNNILLTTTSDGVWVKLVDFGIAKLLYPTDQDEQTYVLTKQGQTVGSPSYMSPEQVQGKAVDARSDVYSLGIVMFEAIAGRLPFKADNALQLAMHHVYSQPVDLKKVAKDCPPYLDRVVARCLAKRPEDRYQNMFELRTDLQLICEGKEPLLRSGASMGMASALNTANAQRGGDDWFEQLVRKDSQKDFIVASQGKLSYDIRLNNVLEEINELGYPGDSILKLQSHDPAWTGILIIRDGRQVIGAHIQSDNRTFNGYEALRRLIAMAQGDFQYFTVQRDDYSLPDSSFRLNLRYILSVYPNLPESPIELEDHDALHSLVFMVESDTRTDWEQVTPVDALLNQLDPKEMSWRPMNQAAEQTPPADFVSRDELLNALAQEQANRNATTQEQSLLKLLTTRLFRSTTGLITTIVFLTAMMAMGFEIVKNTMRQISSGKTHTRKRRSGKRLERNTSQAPHAVSQKIQKIQKIAIALEDGRLFVFNREQSS